MIPFEIKLFSEHDYIDDNSYLWFYHSRQGYVTGVENLKEAVVPLVLSVVCSVAAGTEDLNQLGRSMT